MHKKDLRKHNSWTNIQNQLKHADDFSQNHADDRIVNDLLVYKIFFQI